MNGEEIALKKVAFVAMPFGTKATGVTDGKGPSEVDCDALWEKSIMPALIALGYLPIRADNQTGSVIIKDMLEQLVLADLVLAEISIPNGNVYYEAGVRHAARDRGCILLRAEWSRPLFDLAQITQITYPFSTEEPREEDYESAKKAFVEGIPPLVESVGPVFELACDDRSEALESRDLKEVFPSLFEFQRQLTAARLHADNGDRNALRALIDSGRLDQLPSYALRELVIVVRDHLSWGEMVNLIDGLEGRVDRYPFFYEQKAHALSKLGRHQDSIALLQTVIDRYGATPSRCGTIGSRYRELADHTGNIADKSKYQARAVDYYRTGMRLDLNEYYCALKLLITLIQRGRDGDRAEAERCAIVARLAVERAEELKRTEEWIDSTLAVLAFFEQDAVDARRRVDNLVSKGCADWKLVGLARDLEVALLGVDESKAQAFKEILADLVGLLPVPQADLKEKVLPMIEAAACRYEKFQQVHARPAVLGEVIVSTTNAGEETTNTAGPNDYVVKNLTAAEEQYLVGKEKFDSRYTFVEDAGDGWKLYDPIGAVLGIEITRELTNQLGVGEEFYIMAPWASEQIAQEGDLLVSPLPALDEVYRIARTEFEETYRPVGAAIEES